MRRYLLSVFLLLTFVGTATAALHFPALTNRVVDDAHILSTSTIQSLDQTLTDFEHATTDQLVVVTLPSLEGTSIEDFGYQLARNWGIGQKGKDNGVLMIVAPNEHKVRIEVGYGLEPVLTDAISKLIIENKILPDFRAGRMESGVVDGTTAILEVLGGKPVSDNKAFPSSAVTWGDILLVVIWLGVWVLIFVLRIYFFPWFLPWGGFGGGSFGGGFSSGGFSGGGGGFGGGGASGGW